MKTLLVVLLLGLLPLLTAATPAPGEVTLTARDVISAPDIEEAIKVATNYGTRPGIVTLDARDGPFTYDHPDKSINIFYSGVTLRSLNGAVITNCVDGVFFDNMPLRDVTIQGISFHCTACGVLIPWDVYEAHRVTIRDNTFDVNDVSIGITLGRDVTIAGNSANSVGISDAINLHDTTGARIVDNDLRGYTGVLLDGAGGSQVTDNRIEAAGRGIVLQGRSDGNKVDGNRIWGVQSAGIDFAGEGTGNKVHGNRVTCAPGAACLAVNASPEAQAQNRISGNKLARG